MENMYYIKEMEKGRHLITEGRLNEAERLFKTILQNDRNDYVALSNIGVIRYIKKDIQLATTYFKKALSLRGNFYLALLNLSYIYEDTGQWENMAFQLEKCIALNQGDANLFNRLSKAYMKVGDQTKARQAFSRSIALRSVQAATTNCLQECKAEDEPSKYIRSEKKILNILFVQETPCIRNYKMAKALRSRGHRISLAYTGSPLSQVYKDLSDDVYTECFQIRDYCHLWDISKDYDILHCHNEPDVLTVAALAGNAPVIHDTHDLISLRENDNANLTYFEGIANRAASGRIYSTPYQMEEAKKLYGVNGPSLIFYNYASESDLPKETIPKCSEKDGNIHIVYEGGISSGHRDFMTLFHGLSAYGINIHIYPSKYSDQIAKSFFNNPFIHYYQPVTPKAIIKEMSRYDFGIIPFNLEKSNKRFLDSTIANKLFEYLASGLPVIASPIQSYIDFFKIHPVGIIFNNAKDIVDNIPKLKHIAATIDFSKYIFTYEKEIHNLENFYVNIISNYNLTSHKTINVGAKISTLHSESIGQTDFKQLNDGEPNIVNIQDSSNNKNQVESKIHCKTFEKKISTEKKPEFYDQLFESGGWNNEYEKEYSESAYFPSWQIILRWIQDKKSANIIDCACGPGQFAHFLYDEGFSNYTGIDFSNTAILKAKAHLPLWADKFFVEDLYKSTRLTEYRYDIYLFLEILEHVNGDLNIIHKIPSGKEVIFSVPNFPSQSHVRWFDTVQTAAQRYSKTLFIDRIQQINLHSPKNKLFLFKSTKM